MAQSDVQRNSTYRARKKARLEGLEERFVNGHHLENRGS